MHRKTEKTKYVRVPFFKLKRLKVSVENISVDILSTGDTY